MSKTQNQRKTWRRLASFPIFIVVSLIAVLWFSCVFALEMAVTFRKTNCISYAVLKCWHEGGYIMARKSFYGWWPHVFHVDGQSGVVTEYVPMDEKRKRFFPPIIFSGKVIESDEVKVEITRRQS